MFLSPEHCCPINRRHLARFGSNCSVSQVFVPPPFSILLQLDVTWLANVSRPLSLDSASLCSPSYSSCKFTPFPFADEFPAAFLTRKPIFVFLFDLPFSDSTRPIPIESLSQYPRPRFFSTLLRLSSPNWGVEPRVSFLLSLSTSTMWPHDCPCPLLCRLNLSRRSHSFSATTCSFPIPPSEGKPSPIVPNQVSLVFSMERGLPPPEFYFLFFV